MAEETSALREEIFDLIPFLIQISKMCIPPDKVKIMATDPSIKDCDTGKTGGDINDSKSNKDLDSNENIRDSVEPMTVDTSEDLNKKMNGISVSEAESKIDSLVEKENNLENTDEKTGSKDESLLLVNYQLKNQANKEEETKLDSASVKDCVQVTDEQSVNEKVEHIIDMKEGRNEVEEVKRISDSKLEKEVLNAAELQELHEKADILHFLLPALCHLTAEEDPRHILLKCGGLGVLDLYMWHQWEKLVDQENLRETVSSLVILCNIFLNLIIVEPAMVPENQEFSHILLLVTKGIHLVELDPDYIVLWSHMVTLGLMLSRALYASIDEFLERDSVNRFYVSSIRFLSGAYTVKHKKRQSTLDITETYKMAWEQISQTWFLSMQAFAYCVSLYPDLTGIILKAGWLPGLLKMLTEVKANSVAEETRSCFLLLLTAVAKVDKTAKSVIREKGGLDLARLFKSPELQETLQAS